MVHLHHGTVVWEVVGRYQLSKVVWEEKLHHVVEIKVVVSCLLLHRRDLKISRTKLIKTRCDY